MRAESFGGFQPLSVEGFAGSVKELVATGCQEVVSDTVFESVSFLAPWTLRVRKSRHGV